MWANLTRGREKNPQRNAFGRGLHFPKREAARAAAHEGEEILLSLFSEQLYMPTLRLAKFRFDAEIINLIPEHMAKLYNTIPLSKIGSTLTVAMSDPLNIFALDDLSNFTGCNIDIVLSPEEEIAQAIDTQYHKEAKDQCLEDGFFAGDPVKETKQDKADAQGDYQAANKRIN